jgi:hypothetical protein
VLPDPLNALLRELSGIRWKEVAGAYRRLRIAESGVRFSQDCWVEAWLWSEPTEENN